MFFNLRQQFSALHKQFALLKAARQRRYSVQMADVLQPPSAVRGMLQLEREAFKKNVRVPVLRINDAKSHKILPLIKKYYFKMERLKPVRVLKSDDDTSYREVLLNPVQITSWESLPTEQLSVFNVKAEHFYYENIDLCFENWRADEILKSVLPPEESLGSFSIVGHIVHVNLREHLYEYKHLIGEVLLAKVPRCQTVVNKAAIIDNTYRNFQFELLAGVERYQVQTKENDTTFEFDFSRVYWNPRLSTEHLRIVQMLLPGDVLYDVFAGVGPFSVPAARKGCHVFANDLNPDSYRWLQHNLKRNKCKRYTTYNKDGRDFILQDIRNDLLARWLTPKPFSHAIHITMNLPAIAVEFLDAFRGLLKATDGDFDWENINYPNVHVYCFTKDKSEDNTKLMARNLVEENLGLKLADELVAINFVRNVAPNKDMYRVSFALTKEILLSSKCEQEPAAVATAADASSEHDEKVGEPPAKLAKLL